MSIPKWIIGLIVAASVSGIATASASALENPEILSTVPAVFTTTSGSMILEAENAKSKIECSSTGTKGEFTSVRLGTASVDISGCKSNGLECNTEGDKEGVVLFTGDIHLAATEISKQLVLLLAVLRLKTVTVLCGGGTIVITIMGTLLGEASGIISGKATTIATVTFNEAKGKQAITTCSLDKVFCEKGPYSLTANFGKKPEGVGESVTYSATFSKAVTVDF